MQNEWTTKANIANKPQITYSSWELNMNIIERWKNCMKKNRCEITKFLARANSNTLSFAEGFYRRYAGFPETWPIACWFCVVFWHFGLWAAVKVHSQERKLFFFLLVNDVLCSNNFMLCLLFFDIALIFTMKKSCCGSEWVKKSERNAPTSA